jgi:hypothetical protein
MLRQLSCYAHGSLPTYFLFNAISKKPNGMGLGGASVILIEVIFYKLCLFLLQLQTIVNY